MDKSVVATDRALNSRAKMKYIEWPKENLGEETIIEVKAGAVDGEAISFVDGYEQRNGSRERKMRGRAARIYNAVADTNG